MIQAYATVGDQRLCVIGMHRRQLEFMCSGHALTFALNAEIQADQMALVYGSTCQEVRQNMATFLGAPIEAMPELPDYVKAWDEENSH